MPFISLKQFSLLGVVQLVLVAKVLKYRMYFASQY